MHTMVRQAARRAGLRRERVQAARTYAERRFVLTPAGANRGRPGGRILCYHSLGSAEWGYNDVPPARFVLQLERATAAGYRFVPARRIAEGGGEPMDLALTFDDGARSILEHGAPVLARLGIPWTIFVVTEYAAGRHPDNPDSYLSWKELRELDSQGVDIGSHSLDHPNLGKLDQADAWRELWESRCTLEQELGRPVDTFAIPYGTSRDWTPACQQLARRAGYRLVYAQSEDRRAPNTVPRTFVTSFDTARTFRAALRGAFDSWEEWL